MHAFDVVFVGAMLAFTAVCAVLDWRTRRIPNWFTVPVFALGLVANTIQGGLGGLQNALLGFGTGFGLLLVLWFIGGGGGGDVKMMGALGAWLGPWLTVKVFLASAVATVILVCVAVIYRAIAGVDSATQKDKANKRGTKTSRSQVSDPKRIGRLMPYAVPVAVGTWVILLLAWRSGGLPWGAS